MSYENALRDVCSTYLDQPLEWGIRDCAQFVAAYVKGVTGVDHAPKFGEYDTQTGAYRLMAEYGGLEGLVTQCLGPPKETDDAGDVVICHLGEHLSLGVSNGVYVWTVNPDGGLYRAPLESIVKAWSCRS